MNLTIALIILTGLISYQAFNNPTMKGQLIFHPSTIKNSGQWYRFLTHGLVHADMNHLLVNMFVLFMFGEFIESKFGEIFGTSFGRISYLLFYLSAIVIASVPSYFRHQNNPSYSAVGASGATSALVMAYIFFDPWGWFILPPLPALIFAVVYLYYSNRMDKRGTDNIGHNAHFWGSVYGIFFIAISAQAFKEDLIIEFIEKFLAGPSMPSFL